MEMLLYGLWAVLYLIGLGLGLLTEGTSVFCHVCAYLFFLPPAVLLVMGKKEDRRRVLLISALSLFLTALFLVAGGLTENPDSRVLTFFTVVVSVPMAVSANWIQSLFFWACLLFGSLFGRKK